MAKVTGPFLSLHARGTVADTLTASFWRGISYMRERIIPHNPKSAPQVAIRGVLSDGVSKWRFGTVSEAHKLLWNTYALGLGESGFNRYMRIYIEENYDSTTQTEVSPQVSPTPQ